jgi:hypothetical protein
VAVEPYFSEFIEKLKIDMEKLKHSTDFGLKIYNRLIKQYPQLCPDQYKTYKSGGGGGYGGSGKKLGGKDSGFKQNKNLGKTKSGPVGPCKKKDKINSKQGGGSNDDYMM